MNSHLRHILVTTGIGLAIIGGLAFWPVPRPAVGRPPLTDVSAVAAGYHSVAVLRSDHSVWRWGDFVVSKDRPRPLYPVQVRHADGTALDHVKALASGVNPTVLALKFDGTVWAGGDAVMQVKGSDGAPLSGVSAIALAHTCPLVIKDAGE